MARVAELEGERLRVRARANRWARSMRAARLRALRKVLVVLLLVATFVSGAVLLFEPYHGHLGRKQAQIDVDVIYDVVEKYRAEHGVDHCPSLEQLRAEKEISSGSRLEDPWDRRYEVRCSGPDLRVMSAGRDGRFWTSDDVIAPARRAE